MSAKDVRRAVNQVGNIKIPVHHQQDLYMVGGLLRLISKVSGVCFVVAKK